MQFLVLRQFCGGGSGVTKYVSKNHFFLRNQTNICSDEPIYKFLRTDTTKVVSTLLNTDSNLKNVHGKRELEFIADQIIIEINVICCESNLIQ